ncbi:hypothetical protein ACFOEW_15740 [Alteromonas oceani]|uniref:Uncharacterized protein n=1 Tax=Alteromonas oceani TaxID=2071609 RepID=A0ABV7K2S7_9ALTE|nr:hypothetical protein [Alteromonas oceani]|tara:strand:- start:446 stop:679 length:234 start_codon:yes stop_codon:yes gene_type:complete
MTEQEQKNTDFSSSESAQDILMPCFFIAALISMTDSTARISLSGNDSEKKEQLKKELKEVSVVSQNRAVSKPRKVQN